jgi:hypothetical protein
MSLIYFLFYCALLFNLFISFTLLPFPQAYSPRPQLPHIYNLLGITVRGFSFLCFQMSLKENGRTPWTISPSHIIYNTIDKYKSKICNPRLEHYSKQIYQHSSSPRRSRHMCFLSHVNCARIRKSAQWHNSMNPNQNIGYEYTCLIPVIVSKNISLLNRRLLRQMIYTVITSQ